MPFPLSPSGSFTKPSYQRNPRNVQFSTFWSWPRLDCTGRSEWNYLRSRFERHLSFINATIRERETRRRFFLLQLTKEERFEVGYQFSRLISPSITCQLFSTFITFVFDEGSYRQSFFKAAFIARQEKRTTVGNGWSLSSLTSRSWGQPDRLRFSPILLSYILRRVCFEYALTYVHRREVVYRGWE